MACAHSSARPARLPVDAGAPRKTLAAGAPMASARTEEAELPVAPSSTRGLRDCDLRQALKRGRVYVHGVYTETPTMGQVSVGFQAGGKAYSQDQSLLRGQARAG